MHPHGAVHELHAVGAAGVEDPVEVGGAERGGLLQQQVLPALGGGDGPSEVEAGGKRDVGGVDAGVFEDGLVGVEGADGVGVESVVGDKAAGLLERAATDGDDDGIRGQPDGAGDLAGDLRAPQDAEPDWVARRRLRRHYLTLFL